MNIWKPLGYVIYSLSYIFRRSRGVLLLNIATEKLHLPKANRYNLTSRSHLCFIVSEIGLCMVIFLIILLSGLVSVSTCWQPSEFVLQHPFQSRRYTAQSRPTWNTWIWHFIWHEY